MEPQVWHTLVVRLWRDGDGLKIRFAAGTTGQRPTSLAIATSVESATRQFEEWLLQSDLFDVRPDARPDAGAPASRPAMRGQRPGRRGHDVDVTSQETEGF